MTVQQYLMGLSAGVAWGAASMMGSSFPSAGQMTRFAPSGVIDPHLHSFEETFYILEGSVIVQIGEQAHLLGPGDFGLIEENGMTWLVRARELDETLTRARGGRGAGAPR